MKKILFLTALLVLGIGCNSTYVRNENVGVEKIEKVYSKEYTLENSEITMTLEKDKIYGFAGVNRYFGSAIIDGDNISIENIATTLMMGDEKTMAEEAEYLRNLSMVDKIYVNENEITLTNGAITLKFKKK